MHGPNGRGRRNVDKSRGGDVRRPFRTSSSGSAVSARAAEADTPAVAYGLSGRWLVTRVHARGDDLPVDPDLGGRPSPFTGVRRTPRLRPDVVAAVFAGGCLGGWARYALVSAWHVPAAGFPWPVLVVNLAGAFQLAVLLVLAADLAPSRYLRPLAGTGFCGAFTTFGSVVVAVDRRARHGDPGLATAYLVASIVGGVLAAVAGLALARGAERLRRPDLEKGWS